MSLKKRVQDEEKENTKAGEKMSESTISTERKRIFLEQFAVTGNATGSADAAGVERSTPYRWKESDPEFAAGWKAAERAYLHRLEAEADRRAFEGVERTIYYKGVPVGTERRYSDVLLMFRAKKLDPDGYRDRTSTEISGPNGTPLGGLSDEQRAEGVKALLERAGAGE